MYYKHDTAEFTVKYHNNCWEFTYYAACRVIDIRFAA